jgi:hypothetical protein
VIRPSYSALSLLLLLLVGGCQGWFASRDQSLSTRDRLSTTAPIWQYLERRRLVYRNLKALAQLRLRLSTGRGVLDNAVVALDRFERVRFEGFGPFGQLFFLLISTEKRFALYLPHEGRVITGRASPQQFVRFFGLAIAPEMLPHLLVGDVPFATWPASEALTYVADDDLYFWHGRVPQQSGSYRLWVDPERLLPVRLEQVDAANRVQLRVLYQDFQALGGFVLPYRITLIQPETEQQVVWHYSDVQLNAGVAPELFQMRAPPGVEQLELP